jgi:hypothetical protein
MSVAASRLQARCRISSAGWSRGARGSADRNGGRGRVRLRLARQPSHRSLAALSCEQSKQALRWEKRQVLFCRSAVLAECCLHRVTQCSALQGRRAWPDSRSHRSHHQRRRRPELAEGGALAGSPSAEGAAYDRHCVVQDRSTALHVAAEANHADVITELVRLRADINATDAVLTRW